MDRAKNQWAGLRPVVVVRQSSDKDGAASTAAQLDFMTKELDRVDLTFVDEIVLEGVSAAAPARISETIDELFLRKLRDNDFDVIAWQVEDRASRAGGEYGMWLEHEAKRRGLRVFFAGDDAAKVPYSAVLRVAKYEAAAETSVNTGRRSAQGQNWAQKTGFFRTSGPTPLGCDRVYCGADDRPKFIIRNLANGLQEQRDVSDGRLLAEYGTTGKKSRNRFKKQRNEYSLLMPGDREQQRIVRIIFYLRFKRGWRGCRIADTLNRHRLPSPKGTEWSQRQAQIIYENEAYTGCTFNGQTYSGRFFRRDRDLGFVALERDECELVLRKTFAPRLCPLDEWDRIDQPHMYDFLPRAVRDRAIVCHTEMWAERSDPTRPKRTPNAHPASSYLLTGRLASKQGTGETLRGTMSGPKGHKTPYYRHPRSKRGRRKGSLFNNLIPADALHKAIMNLLGGVLQDTPDLRSRLSDFVVRSRAEARRDQPNVARLQRERDEIAQEIHTLTKTLRGAALAAVADHLGGLGERLNAIESRLESARSTHEADLRPVDEVVNEAVHVIKNESQQLVTLPVESLRDLINRLILNATVDMKTKAVDLTLALPTWAIRSRSEKGKVERNKSDLSLCPPAHSRSQGGSWTQTAFAEFLCSYERLRGSKVKPACYVCQRHAA